MKFEVKIGATKMGFATSRMNTLDKLKLLSYIQVDQVAVWIKKS